MLSFHRTREGAQVGARSSRCSKRCRLGVLGGVGGPGGSGGVQTLGLDAVADDVDLIGAGDALGLDQVDECHVIEHGLGGLRVRSDLGVVQVGVGGIAVGNDRVPCSVQPSFTV